MKKNLKNLLFILLPFIQLNAQDSLVFKSTKVEIVHVDEINGMSVKYKKLNNAEGPVFIVKKAEVDYIRFSNGDKLNLDSLAKANGEYDKPASLTDNLSSDELFDRGRADAAKYYRDNGGSTCIGFTGCLIGIIGVIPALIVASTPPKQQNMDYPSTQLWKNPDYNRGYTKAAHRMKRKKVWTAYGMGLAVSLVLSVMIESTR
jgi:hypothetical protein